MRPRYSLVTPSRFTNTVCATTGGASVAIAIVDSVVRMMPPPKVSGEDRGQKRGHDDRRHVQLLRRRERVQQRGKAAWP